jgi:hypothetical protein
MSSNAVKLVVDRIARSGMGERLLRQLTKPPVGKIDWSTLRRTTPVSRWFGCDRGTPLDRYYIEQFLQSNARNVHGRALEIAEDTYTRRFGGERIVSCDVLHAVPGNPAATIVADLCDAPALETAAYDCIVITQTLQMIFDLRSALHTLHRILKPGGALLATVPGISQISRSDMNQWGDFWRFTDASAQRLFSDAFPGGNVGLSIFGNVLVASAFLHGLAYEDLTQAEVDVHDPDYQMIIGICAVKAAA